MPTLQLDLPIENNQVGSATGDTEGILLEKAWAMADPTILTPPNDSDASDHRPWFQFSLRSIFALGVWFAVTFGILRAAMPNERLYLIALTLLGLFAPLGLAAIMINAFRSTRIWVLASLCCFPFTWIFLYLGSGLIRDQAYANPPLRPMFHNQYVPAMFSSFPSWKNFGPTESDDKDNLMFIDFQDNALVIVVGAITNGDWSGPRMGVRETEFTVGEGVTERGVVVKRTKNDLVVLGQDGSTRHFPLTENAVKRTYAEHWSSSVPGLFVDVRRLLTIEGQVAFDAYLSEQVDD